MVDPLSSSSRRVRTVLLDSSTATEGRSSHSNLDGSLPTEKNVLLLELEVLSRVPPGDLLTTFSVGVLQIVGPEKLGSCSTKNSFKKP